VIALIREQRLATLAALFAALSFVLPLGFTTTGAVLRWTSVAPPFVFACCGLFTAMLAVVRPPSKTGPVLTFAVFGALSALAPMILLATDVATALDAAVWRSGFWCYVVALALLAITTVRRLAAMDTDSRFSAWAALYGTPLLYAGPQPPMSAPNAPPQFAIPGVRHPSDMSFNINGARAPSSYFEGAFRR
jgi:hypothetical protein